MKIKTITLTLEEAQFVEDLVQYWLQSESFDNRIRDGWNNTVAEYHMSTTIAEAIANAETKEM